MSRFILTTEGDSPYATQDVVKQVDETVGAEVIDQSLPNILLVDGPDEVITELVDALPGWKAAVEQTVYLPPQHPTPTGSD